MREAIRDKGRLEHMLDAMDNVKEFTEGITYEELVSNKILCHAVVHNIQVFGEAAYKLTKEFCAAHPEVPWRHIIDLRHVLVHDYYRIDFSEVWKVVKDDLPSLREQIAAYIAEFPEDGE